MPRVSHTRTPTAEVAKVRRRGWSACQRRFRGRLKTTRAQTEAFVANQTAESRSDELSS